MLNCSKIIQVFLLKCNVLYYVSVIIWQVMFSVRPIFLFRGRFFVHLLWDHQRGLDWSIVLNGSCDITIYAGHASGFCSTFVFFGRMRGVFDGRVKFRLVSHNYLIIIKLQKFLFTYFLLYYNYCDSYCRIHDRFYIDSGHIWFYFGNISHYNYRSATGASWIKI